MESFKKFLIVLLVMQILLLCAGIYQLTQGKIGNGLFNIILNTVFGIVNYQNIKRL